MEKNHTRQFSQSQTTTYTAVQTKIMRLVEKLIKFYVKRDEFDRYSITNKVNLNFKYIAKVIWGDASYVAQEERDKKKGKAKNMDDVNEGALTIIDYTKSGQESSKIVVKNTFTISFDRSLVRIADVFFTKNIRLTAHDDKNQSGVPYIFEYVLERNKYLENIGYGSDIYIEGSELTMKYHTAPAFVGLGVVFHEIAHYANVHALKVPAKYWKDLSDQYITTFIENNKYQETDFKDSIAVFNAIQANRYLKGSQLFSRYGRDNFVRGFAEFEAESNAFMINLIMSLLFFSLYEKIIRWKLANYNKDLLFSPAFHNAIQEARTSYGRQNLDDKESYKDFADYLTFYASKGVPLKLLALDALKAKLTEIFKIEGGILSFISIKTADIISAVLPIISNNVDKMEIGINTIYKLILGKIQSEGKSLSSDFYDVVYEMFVREFVFFMFLALVDSFSGTNEGGISSMIINTIWNGDDRDRDKLELLLILGSLVCFLKSAHELLSSSKKYIEHWLKFAFESGLNKHLDGIHNVVRYAQVFKEMEYDNEELRNAVLYILNELAPGYNQLLEEYKDVIEKRKRIVELLKNKDNRDNVHREIEILNMRIEQYNSKVSDFREDYVNSYLHFLSKGIILQPLVFALYKLVQSDKKIEAINDKDYWNIISELGSNNLSKKLENDRNYILNVGDAYREIVSKDIDRLDSTCNEIENSTGLNLKFLISGFVLGRQEAVKRIEKGQNVLSGISNISREKARALDKIIKQEIALNINLPKKTKDIINRDFDKIVFSKDEEKNRTITGKALTVLEKINRLRSNADGAFYTLFAVCDIMSTAVKNYDSIAEQFMTQASYLDSIITDKNLNNLRAMEKIIDKLCELNQNVISHSIKIHKKIQESFAKENKQGQNIKNTAWVLEVLDKISILNISDLNLTNQSLSIQLTLADIGNDWITSATYFNYVSGITLPQEVEVYLKEYVAQIFSKIHGYVLLAEPRNVQNKSEAYLLKRNILSTLQVPPEELPIDIFLEQAAKNLLDTKDLIMEFIKQDPTIQETGKKKAEHTASLINSAMDNIIKTLQKLIK